MTANFGQPDFKKPNKNSPGMPRAQMDLACCVQAWRNKAAMMVEAMAAVMLVMLMLSDSMMAILMISNNR